LLSNAINTIKYLSVTILNMAYRCEIYHMQTLLVYKLLSHAIERF